ncbi:MAG: PAS domain S-box protein [Sphingobacteriia bacterium]|nr:MAG: PAS domain S-box protein [Sphingobacteriia bacterium]
MNHLKADKLFPEQLLNSLIFSVVVTDLGGRFKYVNPLFQYKFSHLSTDFSQLNFAQTVYADDVKLCNDAARECIKNPDKHITVTVRKASEGEDYFWTTWEISVLKNEEGIVEGIVSIGHDVTNTQSVINKTSDLTDNVKTILNQQLQKFVDHIPGVLYRFIADENYTIEFFSDGIEALTGYASSELSINRRAGYNHLIFKDDIVMVDNAIELAIANKHKYEVEYRIVHKDKEIRWVFERGGAVYDAEQNKTFIDGSIFDVTSRKKVEAALERSEDEVKRLALVAHNTTNSVLIADTNQQIIWVNDGFTRISGYTLDEVRGKKIGYSLEGPKVDQKAKTRLQYSLDNKLSFKEEFLSYTKSGNPLWLEVDCQPLFDENNVHIGFMSIENDITRRQQAQLDQEELLQRLTLATDSAQIGIWEIDIATNNIIWDDKMFEMYGYENDPAFPPYKIWKRTVHPEDLDMMQKIIGQLIDGKREIDSAVYRITTPNGRVRHIESHAIVKKSPSGKILRLIGTNRNITEDIVVQEKLKTQNKVLRDIAFIQSHEVRRPLANILGVIEVLNSSNSVNNKEIFDHLIESANELDMQIRSIVKKTNNLDGLMAS